MVKYLWSLFVTCFIHIWSMVAFWEWPERTGGKCEMVQQKPENKGKIFPSHVNCELDKREFVAIKDVKTQWQRYIYCKRLYTSVYSFPHLFFHKAITTTIGSLGSPRQDECLGKLIFSCVCFGFFTCFVCLFCFCFLFVCVLLFLSGFPNHSKETTHEELYEK